MPPSVAQLFYAAGLLLGLEPDSMKNPCKEIAWGAIKESTLSSISSDAFVFVVEEKREVVKEATVAKVKEFCDGANLFDASAYPAHFQGVMVVSNWLQKNLAAREAAIAYFKEVKQEEIETVKLVF